MKPCSCLFVVTALTSLFVFTPAKANTAEDSLRSAVEASEVDISLRYRAEVVDQDSDQVSTAVASTLRSRVTVTTGQWQGWQAVLEVDNVSAIGNDRYNSTVNGNTQYSVVPDPTGTDVNQGLLRYTGEQGFSFSAGRQRANLLDQRFVGGVGWRQNEQTFDGYRISQKWDSGLHVDLSRFHNVNRIFGPRGDAADQRGEFYNLVAVYQWQPGHQSNLFVHDFDFRDWSARSSSTYGIAYQADLNVIKVDLTWAQQRDAHNNPADFTHNYHNARVTMPMSGWQWFVGNERLAGDGVTALQTPLATLHGFQGFADTFLVTPATGLRDTHLGFGSAVAKWRFNVAAHYYTSDTASAGTTGRFTYGKEINAIAQHSVRNVALMYKVAYYDANAHASDTVKGWLMASYQL